MRPTPRGLSPNSSQQNQYENHRPNSCLRAPFHPGAAASTLRPPLSTSVLLYELGNRHLSIANRFHPC